jgi:hypothetical protein
LKPLYKPDIAMQDLSFLSPIADYENPKALAQGVDDLLVNGALSIALGVAMSKRQRQAVIRFRKGRLIC